MLWMLQDFRKAFDTVPHSMLLEKLAAHGWMGVLDKELTEWPRAESDGEWS